MLKYIKHHGKSLVTNPIHFYCYQNYLNGLKNIALFMNDLCYSYSFCSFKYIIVIYMCGHVVTY